MKTEEKTYQDRTLPEQVADAFRRTGFVPHPRDGVKSPDGSLDLTLYLGGVPSQSLHGRNSKKGRMSLKSIRVRVSPDASSYSVATDGTYIPFRCSRPRLPWDGDYTLSADGGESLGDSILRNVATPVAETITAVPASLF